MPAIRIRQLPLNPFLSHTSQKQRQLEDTIPKDSDSVSPGRDVTFTFGNLPDPGPANPFTLKEEGWKPPAPQGDGEDGGDGDLPNGGNPDGGNFNDNNNDDNEVNNHLSNIDKLVTAWNVITTISALANTIKCCKHLQIKVK